MSPSQSESPDSAKQRRINRLCSEIAEYFRNHPHASDTVEGITAWWLTEREEDIDTDVEEALNRLVAQGSVVRKILCDGTFLYQVTSGK
jgi:capsid protein